MPDPPLQEGVDVGDAGVVQRDELVNIEEGEPSVARAEALHTVLWREECGVRTGSVAWTEGLQAVRKEQWGGA